MENNNQQNFNSQQPPINSMPPTPTKKLSNKIIVVIVLVVVTSIVSWIALSRQPKTPDLSNLKIIYANAQPDPNDNFGGLLNIDLYSVKADGTDNKKLFSIDPVQIGAFNINSINLGQTKFCGANNKIYTQTHKFLEGVAPYSNTSIKEIDLNGNIKDLNFTQQNTSQYSSLEYYDKGFALSPDCKKIAWSDAYFGYQNPQQFQAFNEIYVSDINGQNKKVVFSVTKNFNNKIKTIFKWSKQDPNIVYVSDYDWDRNGGGGGLYKLNINDGSIQQITQVPADAIVHDISQDESKIVYGPNFITNRSNISNVVDLTNNVVTPFEAPSNEMLFNFSANKLTDVISSCSGTGAQLQCTSNLYIWDYHNNQKIATNVGVFGWLSDDLILVPQNIDSSGNTALLSTINSDSGNLKNIATVDGFLMFIGITN